MIKKRVIYVIWSVVTAICYFWLSYDFIYVFISGENKLVATISNMALIFIVLVEEALEIRFVKKLKAKANESKPSFFGKALHALYYDAPVFKSALYLYYIAVIIASALIVAGLDVPVLNDMKPYLDSIYYCILVLVAADKFMEKVVKYTDD